MTETYRGKNIEQNQESQAELEKLRENSLERQAEQLEKRSLERKADVSQEDAKKEALEQAATREKERKPAKSLESNPAERRRDHAPTKVERKQAYNTIMKEARGQMSAPSRAFSSFIHNPVIEKTSEFIGTTAARPNAILAGSVSAFIIVLGVYLIARFFGYPLSGSETIISFVAGWIIGIIYDFLRAMITGKA